MQLKRWFEMIRGVPGDGFPDFRKSLGEKGQSAVELAAVLPILMLLVLGTIDLGMGFKTYIGLTNAAREGVRWVSIYPSDVDGALDRVNTEARTIGLSAGDIASGGYAVSISPTKASYAAGEKVTITVNYNYELLFGAVTSLPTVPFSASAQMVVLYDE